jgi:solute carrier family 25 phosphate transporter 23/24/25/41
MQLRETLAQPVFAAFCAGGVAGAVSRTVVSPLERLKILFQIQSVGREEYKMSVGKGLMKMWKEEGWRGFMRGNGTNCIRIVPYSAVQFGSYNFYKRVSDPWISPSPKCLCKQAFAPLDSNPNMNIPVF